jgi:hypothetical protein
MAWSAEVLVRAKDPDGLIYHAYAVSGKGVHDREGRYKKHLHARNAADSLAKKYNRDEVEEDNPFGRGVADYEQGEKPWI